MSKLLEIKTFLAVLKDQGKPELTTVDHRSSIEEAIQLMMNNDYSQLPVVKKDKVVGVISYETIAKTLFGFVERRIKTYSNLTVRDLMEKVPIFDENEDLLDLMDVLATKSFILVKSRRKVGYIITSFDALNFFRVNGEDFLVLNDIEINLRRTIKEKFDESSFESAASKVFAFKKNIEKIPMSVDEMEFSDYTTFVSSNWEKFQEFFGNKELFLSYMEETRKIRNRVCHFNGPLNMSDRKCLRTVLNWLENKSKCLE